jgi:nucleoid DNA-binding protein
MNKHELIEAIAKSSGLKKVSAESALNGFITAVTDSLSRGENVNLIGFGAFTVKHRAERKGRHPQTGVEITISAANIPGFKSGKLLRENIAK